MSQVDYHQLELNAINLRDEYGYSTNLPVDVFGILKSVKKMTLVFNMLSDNIRGMAVNDAGNYFVVINTAYSLGSQRYTAAHELYHLQFHKEAKLFVCSSKEKSKEEVEADAFASYFLLPTRALYTYIERTLSRSIESITFDDAIRIEQAYGISHEALINRLQQLSIDTSIFPQGSVRKRAAMLGYDVSLYKPTKQKSTFGYYIDSMRDLSDNDIASDALCDKYLLDAYRGDLVYGEKQEE